MAKLYTYIGWICLSVSVLLLDRYTFHIGNYPAGSYFQYFLFYRLHDFITQLILMILSIIFFIKSLKLEGRDGPVAIAAAIWCLVGAFASLAWSFDAYFRYPISPSDVWASEWTLGWMPVWLPGLLSALVLLGTSIFFFVIRNYPKNKLLSVKSLKKELLIDPKIDSATRQSFLAKSLDMTSLIHSLNCIKCGSNDNLTAYKVIEIKATRFYGKRRMFRTKYKLRSCILPVCESCSALYNIWYSMHKKPSRVSFLGLLSFCWVWILFFIIFWFSVSWEFWFAIVIFFSVMLLKYKIPYKQKYSPFRNVKFRWRYRLFVKPDNFKKWISHEKWVLYNSKTKESGDIQLSEIEKNFLNYLFENKGSAFSPRALLKRTIGENFTEEYLRVINDLLKKLEKNGMINSDFQNGEFHYFY